MIICGSLFLFQTFPLTHRAPDSIPCSQKDQSLYMYHLLLLLLPLLLERCLRSDQLPCCLWPRASIGLNLRLLITVIRQVVLVSRSGTLTWCDSFMQHWLGAQAENMQYLLPHMNAVKSHGIRLVFPRQPVSDTNVRAGLSLQKGHSQSFRNRRSIFT